MPHPAWISHSISFCVGAAVTAAAGIVLQISSRLDRSDDNAKPVQQQQQQQLRNGTNGKGISTISMLAPRASADATSMLPLLPSRVYQPNDDLTIVFDTRSKNPLFVMERLTNDDSNNSHHHHQRTTLLPDSVDNNINDTRTGAVHASRKNKRFHEEQSLLPYHRSRNQYYRNSGYDRGHLAPAADFAFSDKEMNDTFILTNASPQLPRFNRSIWLRLEEFVRLVASGKKRGSKSSSASSSLSSTSTCTETWVITGPLWLPSSVKRQDSVGEDIFQYSFEGIGKPPSLIAVPTHFYKVVVVVERPSSTVPVSSSTKDISVDASIVTTALSRTTSTDTESNEDMILKEFAAFVVPNADDIVGANGTFRLVDHTVRLTDLEAVTGLEFFPSLFGVNHNTIDANRNDAIPLQKEIADALTDDVRLRGPTSTYRKGDSKRTGNDTSSALVPLSARNDEEYSKGRQKKIQQILRGQSSIPFRHLCAKNELCYKILKA